MAPLGHHDHGALITALFALATGYPSLRVKGHYFAIVTLAFNLIIVIVLVNYSELTRGKPAFPTSPSLGVGIGRHSIISR